MHQPTQTRDPRTFSGLAPTDPDASRAALLDALAAHGARTDDCDHGYGAVDSCPVCD